MRASEPNAKLLIGRWSLPTETGTLPVVVNMQTLQPLWKGSRALTVACLKEGWFYCVQHTRYVTVYKISKEGEAVLALTRDLLQELRDRIAELEDRIAQYDAALRPVETYGASFRAGLTPAENRLLDVLSAGPNKVFSASEILELIQSNGSEKSVQVWVSRCRKAGYPVKTNWGRGYYVTEPV